MAKGDRVNLQREATQANRETILRSLLNLVEAVKPITKENLEDVREKIGGGQKERSR